MSAAPVFTSAHLARIRPDRFTLLLIAIAVLGTGLVLARQVTYGVELGGDSISYISTARGLLAGEGLTEIWAGDWLYRLRPPLYPMLLAAGSLGVFDPWDVAGPLNALCFGLTVLVAGQWLRRHVRSSILTIWGVLAIALSPPLITLAGIALSEAPFFLLVTVALTRFSSWIGEGPRRATLLQAGVFTALACLTHYLGLALIPVFVLMLLLQRNTSPSLKARSIAGYALISVIPLMFYLIRNYLYFGEFTTNFAPEFAREGTRTITGILEETLAYVGEWLTPTFTINEIAHIILAISLIQAVVWIFTYYARMKFETLPFILYTVMHLSIIIYAMNSGQTYHGFEERYITILYIPIIIVLTVSIDGAIHTGRWSTFRISRRIPIGGGIAGISIIIVAIPFYGWLGYNVKINSDEIQIRNPATEFNSELLPYIKRIRSGKVWGNLGRKEVYFHADKGLGQYDMLPRQYDDIPEFIANTKIGDSIIWSKHPHPWDDADYTFIDLLASEGLDFVTTLRDGHVLRVSKRTHAEKYEDITSREPDIVSEFNVYFSGSKLSFIREPCRPSEISDVVYVHIIPRNVSDLPETFRRPGFENRDFFFRTTGVIFSGKCMATIRLPDYQITTIFTGVYTNAPHFSRGQFHPPPEMFPSPAFIWRARINPPINTSRLQADYDAITSGVPVVQSFYSVWIDGPYISYTKDPCEEADTTALFFLHVYPDDDDNLPDEREPDVDFDNLDFVFEPETGSVRFDGKCIATRMLPDYPIASIRTGQYDARGDLWSVDILFEE